MREETFSISQLLCCNTFWKIIFTWSNIIDYNLIYQRAVFENTGELKFIASWIEKSIKKISKRNHKTFKTIHSIFQKNLAMEC